ncbi:V-type proton ATPase subunit C 2 isoform X5 [Pan troglodytes]|uniref:V-type proton ATPase subunit C 2 isoform X5 n=1 Tax=Pan troglodytes TaxID=9598 RepID=UPI0023F3CF80|nr:V-type proton ATPase subunit C 2 isoform X5 [Pan troglodytes]
MGKPEPVGQKAGGRGLSPGLSCFCPLHLPAPANPCEGDRHSRARSHGHLRGPGHVRYPWKQRLGVSLSCPPAEPERQLAQIEMDLKSRTAAYNTLKTNLENLEKKSMGNLFTRTLSDIVSKEDFVLDSEYLVTLLVIVPKPNYSQWQKTYESLSDMVVPRSTKLITEDKEGGLFTVTLFRKVIEDFKTKAKENKFTVREFYYDEKEIEREREEMARLLSDKKQQYQTSCVALKKGSSTFPDHKVKVTPLGNPDRPAAGQTDRERESEGEGEVSNALGTPGSLAHISSPAQAPSGKMNPCIFLFSNMAFEFLNLRSRNHAFLLICRASLELPPPAVKGACQPGHLSPGAWLEVAGAGTGRALAGVVVGSSALLPWLPLLNPSLTFVGSCSVRWELGALAPRLLSSQEDLPHRHQWLLLWPREVGL